MRSPASIARVVGFMFIACCWLTHASAQTRGVGLNGPTPNTGHYYALVIGNNAYTSLPKLKTAETDALEIERLLRESYGFQTKLLVNATRAQIVSALFAYRRELNADANLLIYYAGHGFNDKETDKAYWLPIDATRDDVSNWIIADEITTGIKAIPAMHVLIISDSCYSGTLTRGIGESLPRPTEREQFLQRMAAGHSRTLIASGGNEPVADSGGGSHSVFAAALMRGLREMDKGQFTAAELYNSYVLEAVAGRAQQTPVYALLQNSGHESGDFIFMRIKPGTKPMAVAVKAGPAAQSITVAPLSSSSDASPILGKYFETKGSGSYLELKSDGTFFLSQAFSGRVFQNVGSYQLEGQQITLKLDMGMAARGMIEKDKISFEDGSVYVRGNAQTVSTPPPVAQTVSIRMAFFTQSPAERFAPSQLTIGGMGWDGGSEVRVLVNGQDVTKQIDRQITYNLLLKGSVKELNIKDGKNEVVVVVNGVSSSPYEFKQAVK